MNGKPAGSARPSAWLATPALPSRKAKAIGDGPLGASSKPGASVGATEAIASVYACRFYTARMPLGCMLTVLAQVGLSLEKSREKQRKAEKSREKQRKAEKSREKQRKAEKSREKQRKAEKSREK